jgi:hypothetical protein
VIPISKLDDDDEEEEVSVALEEIPNRTDVVALLELLTSTEIDVTGIISKIKQS